MTRLLLRKVAAVRAGCRVEQHVDLKSRGGLVSSGPQWSAVVSQSDDIWSLLLSRFHLFSLRLSSYSEEKQWEVVSQRSDRCSLPVVVTLSSIGVRSSCHNFTLSLFHTNSLSQVFTLFTPSDFHFSSKLFYAPLAMQQLAFPMKKDNLRLH